MARLKKADLLHVFENSLRDSGCNFLLLSPPSVHPARYSIFLINQSFRTKVYIWNITPGGRNRPANEWRIQVTPVRRFEPEIGGKTLILGWWDDVGVFAGFDYTRHTGDLGASPSIQIREAALRQAAVQGFAPHSRGRGELAIAFRPDLLGSYIENLEALHGCGEREQEVEILREIGEDPERVEDDEIDAQISAPRRFAVRSTKRALREIDFRDRVLTAYGHRCAMCGVQLKLLEGAHILPVSEPESTDSTNNGVALCVLHHRAYDRALVTFTPDYSVCINDTMIDDLRKANQISGLEAFRRALRPILILPPEKRNRPDIDLVRKANRLRGWRF